MTEKIVVHDLKKSFHHLEVLKGINLTVNEGEVVCVIGPSGGGKSTFLRCLNRLEEPTGGQIFVDGYEITIPRSISTRCARTSAWCFRASTSSPTCR